MKKAQMRNGFRKKIKNKKKQKELHDCGKKDLKDLTLDFTRVYVRKSGLQDNSYSINDYQ